MSFLWEEVQIGGENDMADKDFNPVGCEGFVTPPKREGLYCSKCKAKTPHHYFMMGPTGVMVCNICGTDYDPEVTS